jgi:hypothetical protein
MVFKSEFEQQCLQRFQTNTMTILLNSCTTAAAAETAAVAAEDLALEWHPVQEHYPE